MPETDGDAGSVGGKTQDVEARAVIVNRGRSGQGRFEQFFDGACPLVWIVLRWLIEKLREQRLHPTVCRRPEYSGGIANLDALFRGQQVIECRGVGESGALADGGVRTLLLAIRIEAHILLERNQILTSW